MRYGTDPLQRIVKGVVYHELAIFIAKTMKAFENGKNNTLGQRTFLISFMSWKINKKKKRCFAASCLEKELPEDQVVFMIS